MQELAGRGPWGRCAVITSFCGLLWCRYYKRGGRRCCSLLCSCLRCRCLCCCRRRAPRPGQPAPAARPARHEDSETESEGEQGAERLCQADQVALDHHGKVTSLTLEPCRDVARGSPVALLAADGRVSCFDDLAVDQEGRAAFGACEYHRAMYGSSQDGRVCSVQGCVEAASVYREGIPLCRLHGAREDKPAVAAKPPAQGLRRRAKAAPRLSDTLTPTDGARDGSAPGPVSSQEVADVVTELLPGRTQREAYGVLQAHAAERGDRRPWLDAAFQQAVEEASVAYLARAQRDGLQDTPAYAALQTLVARDDGRRGPRRAARPRPVTFSRGPQQELSRTPRPRYLGLSQPWELGRSKRPRSPDR